MDSSDVAMRLADISGPPDHVTIITPGSGKKKGFFKSKKHRKTPSLPTRLVMRDGRAIAVADNNISCNTTGNISTTESAYDESASSPMLRSRRRGYSADGTPGVNAIRRGRPNTVSVGLPVDKAPGANRSRRSMDLPPRHSSQRDIFASPERNAPLDCDGGVIDTSPILKADPLDVEMVPGSLDDFEGDEESMLDQAEESWNRSTSSMGVDSVPHNQAILEPEHDEAFIHEASVITDQPDKPSSAPDSFKKPVIALMKKTSTSSETGSDFDKMNASVTSDASDTSVITVLYNGQPVKSKRPLVPSSLVRPKSCHNLHYQKPETVKQMRSQLSAGSIDSGLGHESQDNVSTKLLPKSHSKNSLISTDSALGKEEEVKDTDSGEPMSVDMLQTPDRKFQRECSDSVLLQKTKVEVVRRRSHEPNLHMSPDVKHMLSRSGMMSQEASKLSQSQSKQSVANLREKNAGKVAENVKQFDQSQQDMEQLAEKKASPLRFSNSVSRRGNSPLRIPTIFAKADEEAAKYRDIANRSRGRTSPVPKLASHRPTLPISTNLLRTASVESAKQKLTTEGQQEEEPSSSEPMFPPPEMSESLMETINDVCTPKCDKLKKPLKDSTNMEDAVSVTPRIKPCMLSASLTAKFLSKGLAGTPRATDNKMRRVRSPVKPVKRLQGSPSSPRSPHKSPSKMSNRHSLSPLPAHVSDWNF